MRRPCRRSNSSVNVYCSSGNAPGRSTTLRTSSATSAGSNVMPSGSAGPDDRALELGGGHRRDHLGALAQQLAEPTMPQWSVVEVGPQRCNDTDATVLIGDGADQHRQEPTDRLGFDLREQLLELVDDEQQLRPVARQDAADRPLQPALAAQLLEQRRRRVDGDAEQRRLELFERVRCRRHLDREPRARRRRGPWRIAGSSPALTTLDLPLPLGPTTAMNRPRVPGSPRRLISRSTSRSRPWKSAASAASKARRPLYGLSISTSRSDGIGRIASAEPSERRVEIADERADVCVALCRIDIGRAVDDAQRPRQHSARSAPAPPRTPRPQMSDAAVTSRWRGRHRRRSRSPTGRRCPRHRRGCSPG